MRLDNIGDVVMLGPALKCLRQHHPLARITLMVSPAGSKVAPMLPWIDDILVHRPIWQDINGSISFDPDREWKLINTVKQGDFDAAFIFTSFSQSPHPPAFICRMAGIPLRFGQSKETGDGALTHCFLSPPDEIHQVDRNLYLLESAGMEAGRRDLELRLPEEADQNAKAALHRLGIHRSHRFIVAAPGASCPSRRYDIDRFAEALGLLRCRTGMPVVVVGSEREAEMAGQLLRGVGERRDRFIAGPVTEMAGVIARGALLIGNNSGPMHIADAVRTPMIILFSGTDQPSQWRPRSAPARLLAQPVACSPCRAFVCSYNMECLDVPPREVADAGIEMLQARPRPASSIVS